MREIRNPKSEIRRNAKAQSANPQQNRLAKRAIFVSGIVIWDFEFPSDFVLRISSLLNPTPGAQSKPIPERTRQRP
jgi:hypothetical protein